MASPNQTSKNCDINLKIVSFNVRGLRNHKKRKTLFHTFKKNGYDIICLQETYLLKNDMAMIEKEWGSKFHITEGTKRSKGLLTLFSKRFQDDCLSLVKEGERFIISSISLENTNFTIFNVYAPCIHTEKFRFLNNIVDNVNNLQLNQDSNLIILGDFNMVLDNKLDILAGEKHNDRIVNSFNNLVNELFLVDIWRHLKGKKQEFSWSKSKPYVARRLDYIFISESLLPFCKSTHLCELGFSDHKCVFLNIDFSSFF